MTGTSWLCACGTLNPSELMSSGSCGEQLRSFAWLCVWALQHSCSATVSQSAGHWGHCMWPVQLLVPVWHWSICALREGAEPPRKPHRVAAEGWQWRHHRLCVATGNSCWLGGLFALKMLYFLQTQLDVKFGGYEFVQCQTTVTPPGKQCRGIIYFKQYV